MKKPKEEYLGLWTTKKQAWCAFECSCGNQFKLGIEVNKNCAEAFYKPKDGEWFKAQKILLGDK